MKTLLIDDKREITADVVARTFDEGMKALKEQGPFDLIILDNDLGDLRPGHEGYHILCWLEEHPEHLPKQIIPVTDNSVRLRDMRVVIAKLYPRE